MLQLMRDTDQNIPIPETTTPTVRTVDQGTPTVELQRRHRRKATRSIAVTIP